MESDQIEAFQQVEKQSYLQKIKSFLALKKFFLFSFFCLFILLLAGFLLWGKLRKKPVYLSPLGEGEILSTATSSGQLKEVIGFLPSWMAAKQVKVYPERLSQLIYFGLGVNDQGSLIFYDENNLTVSEWAYFNSGYFKDLKNKTDQSKTKVLVAIKSFDNETIDKIISNSINRPNLINNILDLIEKNDLNGINIDFEYIPDIDFPTRPYFNLFIKELSQALDKKNPDLILSVDVYANAAIHNYPYDLEEIAKHVDQIILMAYDFYRADSTKAGPVAPIRAPDNEPSITKTLAAVFGKVSRKKLVLGIPFYGYEWQTYNDIHKSFTVKNTGALATFGRVKKLVDDNNIEVFWDSQAMSPWLVYNQGWLTKQIYFENEKSLALKFQLAKQLQLNGIAIWALGYEGNYLEPWQIIEDF